MSQTQSSHRPSGKGGRYHHGDLRSALLDAAHELVARKGVSGFSMKDAAAMAEVSVAAPYRHFADRDDLLAAVAERGFEDFGARLRAARDAHETGSVEAIIAMGHAYVQFISSNENLARLMFDHRNESGSAKRAGDLEAPCQRPPGLLEAGERSFQVLLQAVSAFLERHGRAAHDPLALAVPLWTLVHGTAHLSLAHNFDHTAPGTDVDALIEASTHHFLNGYLNAER